MAVTERRSQVPWRLRRVVYDGRRACRHSRGRGSGGPHDACRNANAIERWNATVDEAFEAAERHRLPDGSKVLLENIFRLDAGDEGEIAAGAECPFLGQEAWVASDGRFNPCCAPDALRRTLGDFGSVNNTSLYDIWQSAAYGNLRSSYMQKPLCQGCNMRRPEGT